MLSDFLDRGFEQLLKRTGRRHDLIAIRITDPREEDLPMVGLLELEDAETGKRVLLDTSSRQVRERFAAAASQRREEFRQVTRAARIDLLEVATDGRHLEALVHFFQQREHRLRKR